jgi:hypothetical protein
MSSIITSIDHFQHRRLSYSRHAVDDRDLTTQVSVRLRMKFNKKKSNSYFDCF